MSSAVRIGRVTGTPNARIHLAIDGRTCGAAHRAAPVYQVTRVDLTAGSLCRRCFRPGRIKAAEMALTSAWGAGAERIRQQLAAVVQACKTPAQRADDADLIPRIRRTIEVAAVVNAAPLPERRDLWHAARDSYDARTLQAA